MTGEIGDFPCRPGCGACCIVPSISSPIPGMPQGKAGDVPCIQLTAEGYCRLFGQESRPPVCSSLKPNLEMCGHSREEAMAFLQELDRLTKPL